MSYNDKLAFCLPGKTVPEDDVRVVVQFIVSELRGQYYKSEGQHTVAPVKMSDALKQLGYPTNEVIQLLAFLQHACIIVRLSVKQGTQYLWYCTTQEDAVAMPVEYFEAAWREVKAEAELKDRIKRLDKQLVKFQSNPDSTNVEFLAQVDAIAEELARERDEAISERDGLRQRITELEEALAARPETDAEIIRKAFLEKMEKHRLGLRTTGSTRRRSR